MIWLTGGQVYDVEAGDFRRADIRIEGDRIVELSEGGTPEPADSVHRMDGAWLLPGLIDCHVHLVLPTDLADPSRAARRSDAAVALFAAKAAERTLLGGTTTAFVMKGGTIYKNSLGRT